MNWHVVLAFAGTLGVVLCHTYLIATELLYSTKLSFLRGYCIAALSNYIISFIISATVFSSISCGLSFGLTALVFTTAIFLRNR